MTSLKFTLLTMLASLAIVQAARYCQCENKTFGRIFPGINQVCSGLSDSWCSTNCAWLTRKNCNYCQYTPAGPDPDADYQKLKSWCFQQEGYDYGKQQAYKGSEVNCYSFNGKAHCGSCGGCGYSESSFYKRDLLDGELFERQGSDSDSDFAPDASVTFEQSVLGVKIGGSECFLLFPSAAQDIANLFVDEHPSACGLTMPTGGEYLITCNAIDEPLLSGYSAAFTTLCQEYGGQQEDVDGEGNFIHPEVPDDADPDLPDMD